MTQSDDDSDPPPVNTNEFFLPGSGLSALLIHGLTGTPYEMRLLGERLAAAGVRVEGIRLAGHGRGPEELGDVTHANWYESVVEGFERLRAYDEPNIVIGLSMGAVLAARLAIDQREAVSAVVMLAPAFYLPFWTRMALRMLRPSRNFANRIYIHRQGGSDIHDASARRVHPGNRLMPLRAALDLIELSDQVRAKLPELVQPTLVIQSRRDHTCPFTKNTEFLMNCLGGADKRLVALDESFHVITVDSERERVVQETLDFILPLRRIQSVRALAGIG
ncbi:MAG: alpha/beta fold hydrolase [Deltaproteobacteria bacterium]|nr:alpha/beta fold hydrolase [Deltaproteobacteria bacterium]MBV8454170.1 alpha/beta fold hydrolase [Deltaproteobacteria bacterium]